MKAHIGIFVVVGTLSFLVARRLTMHVVGETPPLPMKSDGKTGDGRSTSSIPRPQLARLNAAARNLAPGRENLPISEQVMLDARTGLCELNTSERFPAELMAKTPFRTQQEFLAYYDRNRDGFNEIRYALFPVLLEKLNQARACALASRDFEGRVDLDLEITIDVSRSKARLSKAMVAASTGTARATDAVQRCVSTNLTSADISVSPRRPGLTFAEYVGVYPNHLPLHFSKDVDVWTGSPIENGSPR
jgi:hypothetical protein